MIDTTQLPGTYREATGDRVDFQVALFEWEEAARPSLFSLARHYHATTTYEELAEEVQHRSGVRTRALLPSWIGKVLGDVAVDCHRRGEPLLSALCVHKNGTIGPGYADAVAATYGGDPPADFDLHAAAERLRCHQYFHALDLPAGGGVAALAPQVAAKHSRARRKSAPHPYVPPMACPTHHLALLPSGKCPVCG
jgi:hypothetical protein